MVPEIPGQRDGSVGPGEADVGEGDGHFAPSGSVADALIAEGRVTARQNDYGDQRADVAGRPVMPTKAGTL